MFVLMLIEFDEKDTGGMPGKLLPFREGTACGRTMKDPRLESTASKIDFQPPESGGQLDGVETSRDQPCLSTNLSKTNLDSSGLEGS
jgi:hypothetical protein